MSDRDLNISDMQMLVVINKFLPTGLNYTKTSSNTYRSYDTRISLFVGFLSDLPMVMAALQEAEKYMELSAQNKCKVSVMIVNKLGEPDFWG